METCSCSPHSQSPPDSGFLSPIPFRIHIHSSFSLLFYFKSIVRFHDVIEAHTVTHTHTYMNISTKLMYLPRKKCAPNLQHRISISSISGAQLMSLPHTLAHTRTHNGCVAHCAILFYARCSHCTAQHTHSHFIVGIFFGAKC